MIQTAEPIQPAAVPMRCGLPSSWSQPSESDISTVAQLLKQALETPDFELHLFGLRIAWSANKARKDRIFSWAETTHNPFGAFVDD